MEGVDSFGHWVRRYRRMLDLTQSMLGDRVGCSEATIRKIEADERRPSLQIARRLATVLQIGAHERELFLQVARGEVRVERLPGWAGLSTMEMHTAPARVASLPIPATPLVDREHDLAVTLDLLLQPNVHLLTITGPPGVGKTRLAIVLAQATQDEFADGSIFVPLAELTDAEQVPATILRSLALSHLPAQPPLNRLLEYVHSRNLLLVLDNFEHLPTAVPLLVELLAAAPRLKLLVTSQAKLPLAAQREYPLAPLALPNSQTDLLEQLARNPACVLFEQRAQAVLPGFQLNDANVATIAAICIRLDGLPLAIELAAARSKLFSPQALLARLDQQLALLISADLDLPPRHRSLRTAFNWSHNLLRSDEQVLFRRLGAFVGGCSLEAVEAVAATACEYGAGSVLETNSRESILNQLEALVNKSLLLQAGDQCGEPRFSMLQSVQSYALEQLALSGEGQHIFVRHATYYLHLAEQANLLGNTQVAWLDRLDCEHGNFRAAFNRMIQVALDLPNTTGALLAAQISLRLGAALWRFWHRRDYHSEGRRALDQAISIGQALASSQPELHAPLAEVLLGAGVLADEQGDHEYGLRCYQQSLHFFRSLGIQPGIADTLRCLGAIALGKGDYTAAQDYLLESLQLYRQLNDERGMASSLLNLGIMAQEQGDLSEAERCYGESLALDRRVGDLYRISITLSKVGLLAYARCNDTRAHAFFEENLALCRCLGDQKGIAHALANLGRVALRQKKFQQARSHFIEGLQLFQHLADLRGLAECLEGLAGIAGIQNHAAHAARLLGTAAALRTNHLLPVTLHDQELVQPIIDKCRTILGAEGWEAEWTLGKVTNVHEIIPCHQRTL